MMSDRETMLAWFDAFHAGIVLPDPKIGQNGSTLGDNEPDFEGMAEDARNHRSVGETAARNA